MRQLFPSASKCKNIKNIPCPTFADIASAIRALVKLILANNRMASKDAGRALAEALTANSTIKEIDVSSNTWEDEYGNPRGDGPGFAKELAVGVAASGALATLGISNNDIHGKELTYIKRLYESKCVALAAADNATVEV